MPCRVGGQLRTCPLAPGTLLSSAISLVCGVALGGGEKGVGSRATVLARSQGKADSGLLNFSRWRIKRAVADCPRAERAAGLEPPTCPGPGGLPAHCSASPLSAGCPVAGGGWWCCHVT